MSSNPWGKKDLAKSTKDWSEQVEEEEAQNGGMLPSKHDSPRRAATPDSSFPTLGEAAKVKTSKKKLSLTELHSSGGPQDKYRPSGYSRRELTDEEIRRSLPTGPRERDPNEPSRGGRGGWGDSAGGHGGGFRQGGGGGGSYGSMRYDDQPRREDDGPSRADESDNWGREKKYVSGGGGMGYDRRPFSSYEESRDRGQSRHAGFDDFPGKADEADDWKRDNKFTPSSRGFGGGGYRDMRDSQSDRGSRGYGFGSRMECGDISANRADTEDRWVSSKSPAPAFEAPKERQRPRLQLSARTKPLAQPLETRSSNRSSVFGDAKPREEVLKERRASEIMSGSNSDAGSQYGNQSVSHPGTPVSAIDSVRSGHEAYRPKPRSDPFGGARPREENLTHG